MKILSRIAPEFTLKQVAKMIPSLGLQSQTRAIWRGADLLAIIQRQEVNVVGYLAASLVLATFCMHSMRGLRSMALASNLAFVAYGYLADLMPVLLLHVVLSPVNVYRLVQLLRIDLRPK